MSELERARDDRQALLRLIAELRARYAPQRTAWTDLDADAGMRMTALWCETLGRYSIDRVAEAIEVHIGGARGSFFPTLQELDEGTNTVVRARAAGLRHDAIAAASQNCNGDGWIETEDGGRLMPCGRCNPVLRAVFNDRDKWKRYLDGTPLEKLGVGVERVTGKLTADTSMPSKCQIDERHGEQQVAFDMDDFHREHSGMFGDRS